VIGEIAHGDIKGPCPSLVLVAGIYRCDLMLREAHLPDRRVSRELGAGVGCSMWDEGTTEIEAFLFDAFAKVRTRELHPFVDASQPAP
jgi:hypothetical protein